MVRHVSADAAVPPASVDELLFAGRIIEAMSAFREWSGCDLQAAIDGVGERIAISDCVFARALHGASQGLRLGRAHLATACTDPITGITGYKCAITGISNASADAWRGLGDNSVTPLH